MTQTEQENATAKPVSLWKKIVLSVALLTGLAGAGLHFMSPEQSPPSNDNQSGLTMPNTWHSQSLQPQQFINQPPTVTTQPPAMADDMFFGLNKADWSSLLMKLGFSFVAGFSIGYALMASLKLALLTGGFLLLALFGLQYGGVISVDWQSISGQYDGFIVWFKPHMSSFHDFITSHLPSSSMAVLGLVMGFKA